MFIGSLMHSIIQQEFIEQQLIYKIDKIPCLLDLKL